MIEKLLSFIAHLSKRERAILYSALFLISVFILVQLILIPVASKTKSLDQEINEQKKMIKNVLLVLARKEQIEEEEKIYKVYLEQLESKERTVVFLKNIENLVKESGVNLLDIRPIGSEKKAPFQKYLFTLNCEAPMKRILDFFHRVETSQQLLGIESFRITPKSEKGAYLARCSIEISKTVVLLDADIHAK